MRLFVLVFGICAGFVLPAYAMEKADFETAKQEANRAENDFVSIQKYDVLLNRKDLSLDQRVQALYGRAIEKCMGGQDSIGGQKDYKTIVEIAPTHRLAKRAAEQITYVQGQIDATQERILTNEGPDHFRDLFMLGRHDEAISYIKKNPVMPNSVYIQDLEEMGKLCPVKAGQTSLYTYQLNGRIHFLTWCAGQ